MRRAGVCKRQKTRTFGYLTIARITSFAAVFETNQLTPVLLDLRFPASNS